MSDPNSLVHLQLNAVPNPLRVDDASAIRVGASRVTLDLVVEQYENGQTPDEMVRAYDTLDLAEVHAAIAYYLRNRNEVLAYLRRRMQAAANLQSDIQASQSRPNRDELAARRQG